MLLRLFVFLFSVVFVAKPSSVPNVRLVDHTSYAISIIQKVVNRVEKNHWCNLKVDDVTIHISENVLGVPISGDVEFFNGFLFSLQNIDIIQHTVQQLWLPVTGNTTSVEVRATMRMLNVVIGFDVDAKTDIGQYRTTGVMRYPEIQFPFVIAKNLFTDEITVTVNSILVRTTNVMEFTPENDVTKILSVLFDWNCTGDSINRWATDVFAPITLDLATADFPRICYNCQP